VGKVSVKPGEAEAILNAFGLEQLCDRLVGGETQTAICKTLGITKGSLSRWVSLDAERQARVHEARIASAEAFDELAEEGIRKARNPLMLAKAREIAHHLRWRSSKVDPRRYGEKLQVDQQTTVINLSDDEIVRRRQKILDDLAAHEVSSKASQ
jgi:hypothetical protein